MSPTPRTTSPSNSSDGASIEPSHAAGAAVEIVGFAAPDPTPGGEVAATLRVRNNGSAERTFRVGFSVRSGDGTWHDVPSVPVTVGPHAVSDSIHRAWRQSDRDAGPFHVVAAVWDGPPESGTAGRLDERRSEVWVDPSDVANEAIVDWRAGDHDLGRGRLVPAHVIAADGRVRLRLPAGTCDGAQIASPARHACGSFRAVMRAADAPGSLSAFFLYEDVSGDANDEADIEVMNDGSGRALLSLWCSGRQTHGVEVDLGFDPRSAAHEYRIDIVAGTAAFYVDGLLLGRFADGVPTRPMRVMANAWWPRWLSGPQPEEDRFTGVNSIRILPAPPVR